MGGKNGTRIWPAISKLLAEVEGQQLGGGIEVASVNRRLAKGIQLDLVLINRQTKTITVHDLTSQLKAAHVAKGKAYVRYFESKYPDYRVEYTESHWRGLEDVVEATRTSGIKYFPGTTRP